MAGGRGGGADAGQVWGQVSTSIPPALPLGKCPQMRAPEPAQLVGHLSHSFLSRANTGVSWGWGGAGGGELDWGQGLGKRPRGRGPWTISCLLLCPLLQKGAASSCGKRGIYIQWLFQERAWMGASYDRGLGFLQVCLQGRLEPSPHLSLSLEEDETGSHVAQADLQLTV